MLNNLLLLDAGIAICATRLVLRGWSAMNCQVEIDDSDGVKSVENHFVRSPRPRHPFAAIEG